MSSMCPKCSYLMICEALHKDSVVECEDFKRKKQTHYDRLVSMMPEDLADAIVRMQYRKGDFCPPNHSQNNLWCLETDGCRSCWLNWLRQEVG